MTTKLYRSRTDRMLGGVCGGLGKYLRIDPTFVRLFFVLLALGGSGIGILLYFLLWIILPQEGREEAWEPSFGEGESLEENVKVGAKDLGERARAVGEELREAVRRPNPQAGLIIGGALIILGFVYLLDNLNIPWLRWLDFDVLWPLLLILGGIVLLLRHFRGE